ncbi:protein-ADP-ribose hydrolase [Zongyangia sp. HA2173]|uniref:protein-ADP-ribose hydrolase n=1 Tax=Zongyangia sp. HA2173 TaxID=3133035 RepID=UPI003168522F
MTQAERRRYLIQALLEERPEYADIQIPPDVPEQKSLLRSLFNVRMPWPISEDFLKMQDAYLQEEIRRKGITGLDSLHPVREGIYLWQGDITTLRCDAIVNAANSGMLGCFVPCHGCIDNAIHTFAGVQLRLACARIMDGQGRQEETGGAKLTPAFNLPCRYILHTVGPIVSGRLTQRDCDLLASCYRSCLELAEENHIKSVAFCCISTGEFHFPNRQAAEIAVNTVMEFKEKTPSNMEVIFNVFKNMDAAIYRALLQQN